MEFQILKEVKDDRVKFFRYTSRNCSYNYNAVIIEDEVFYLEKETPCGYWIVDGFSTFRKWVSKTTRKRYAYPTREEALNSLYYRKKRQVIILEAQLKLAKSTIKQIDAKEDNMQHTAF